MFVISRCFHGFKSYVLDGGLFVEFFIILTPVTAMIFKGGLIDGNYRRGRSPGGDCGSCGSS